jgi:membrane-associated phospholipid phosphatase
MLLSDRWSSGLIELLRPISGLDNCFPSTHVSFTVVIILVGYLFRVRLRHTILALGMTTILSTFVLGIHWLPDILAGVAVAFLSVALARRMTPLTEYAVAS